MSTTVKIDSAASRVVWNKGRLVGQKRPFRLKEVWAIRVRLQIEDRKRDLVLFNLAIDSKLRGWRSRQPSRRRHVAAVKERATIIQHKTGRPVQFEIMEQTRVSLQEWYRCRRAFRPLCDVRTRDPQQRLYVDIVL